MTLERDVRLCPLTCPLDQYRAMWPQRSPTEPVPDDDFNLVDLPHQKDFPELEVGRAGLLATPATIPAARHGTLRTRHGWTSCLLFQAPNKAPSLPDAAPICQVRVGA